MKATALFGIFLVVPPYIAAAELPKDLGIELPRDVRILLLGVPSIENAKTAEGNLRAALEEYEQHNAGGAANPGRLEQDKARICFRLGKLDESLATLVSKLRELERIKGLEDYRILARELQVRSESFASYCGDSTAPVVEEEITGREAADIPATDFVSQLKGELAGIDEPLQRIAQRAKPDQERRAQLEQDLGAIGQVVLDVKNVVEKAKNASNDGQSDSKAEIDDLIQDVDRLVGLIRELKERKQVTEQRERRPSREPKRSRVRYRYPN